MVDNVREVIGALEDFTETRVRRLAAEITAELIETTPVETGWARANWVPAIGQTVVNREQLSREERDARVGSQAATQQNGLATVTTTWTLRSGPIYISNGVPYIGRLNNGHSAQAPVGFVQQSIRRALATLNRS